MIEQITFRFPGLGVELRGATEYDMDRKFADIATVSIEIEDNAALKLVQALQIGTKVQCLIGKYLQGTFFIERIQQGAGRLNISGRDQMGFIADCHISTHIKFSEGMTVKQVVETILKTMPVAGKPLSVLSDDAANIKAIISVPDGEDPPPKSQIGATTCSQLKIKRGEGALEFIRKFLDRFNLHMWASADGESVIISTPSYFSTPFQKLVRDVNGNVEDGQVTFNIEKQPSFLYTAGRGASNDFDHAAIKCVAYNELTGTDQDFNVKPEIFQFLKENPDLKDCTEIALIPQLKDFRFLLPDLAGYPMKPAFFVDNNANTSEELQNFTRKKLAELRKQCIEATYMVAGHADRGMPWTVNRMVSVQDTRLNVNCAFFVAECKFRQSRSHGTRTTLKLIPPFSI